jgi:YegS/Rv2252/BmrU family lipid kinase
MTEAIKTARQRKVRVLVNRRSGFMWSFKAVQDAFDRYWDTPENDLSYQFCRDPVDGRDKARRTAEEGHDILLVVGGDGTVNTTGSALIGTETALGVVPMGSGNGFARHFGIPLKPEDAARALADAEVQKIDVGMVNDMTFLVTCSMAWDAAIVKSFERSPVRGVVPYVFAGVYEFLSYEPQQITAELDSGEVLTFPDPVVFTIANLTQYGGGAIISRDAQPDDGMLDLVVARKQDIPVLAANIHRLLTGSIVELPRVVHRRFRSLTATRANAAQIQIDGELADVPQELRVRVQPRCLHVLVPRAERLP